ncbi:MAG: nucleotide exchange factor GrpE, partial [Eubacteriales bacterium]
MTKKTVHNEPDVQEPVTEEKNTKTTAKAEEAEAVVAESAKAEDQDAYTLTAEEFAAAKAHIESITKEKDDTIALLQRIQADFDNFRRRNSSIRLESYEEGKRDTVKELLPALDSLERALENIPEENATW